jgi:hypothetical protein
VEEALVWQANSLLACRTLAGSVGSVRFGIGLTDASSASHPRPMHHSPFAILCTNMGGRENVGFAEEAVAPAWSLFSPREIFSVAER